LTRSKNFSKSNQLPTRTFFQILHRFGDGRLATATRTKPVTARVECRFIHRFEHLTYGLLNHSVNHLSGPAKPTRVYRPGCLRFVSCLPKAERTD